MNLTKSFWRNVTATFVIALILTACGTTKTNSTLNQKPTDVTTAIKVIFVTSTMVTSQGRLLNGTLASDPLSRVGFYSVGERVVRLSPAILKSRGIQTDAAATTGGDNFPGGLRDEMSKTLKSSGSRILLMSFKDGQTSNYGGPTAVLNLQVVFRDVMTPTVYWSSEYRNAVKQTPFGGVTFDDQYVTGMLNQIFADMESNGLIPAIGEKSK